MRDEYFINVTTGEILPGEKAINQYYAVDGHGILENWLDEWQPIGQECEHNFLAAPDFAGTVRERGVFMFISAVILCLWFAVSLRLIWVYVPEMIRDIIQDIKYLKRG